MKTAATNPKEVLIAGYTTAANGKTIAALILATKEEACFHYYGSATSGFESDELQHKLMALLKPLCVAESPLEHDSGADKVTWVKPVLVCEVNDKKSTQNNTVRDSEFLWLREDKNIQEHLDKTA